MIRLWLLASILLSTMLTITSCGQGEKTQTIRAAFVPAGFYAPILLADSRGYFAEEGYEIELARYNNNSLMINAFINGAVDLTAQSALTMFPIEEENPGRYQFVYGQYANSYFFVVPTESDIQSFEDLANVKIGTWQSPTAVAYITLVAASKGMSIDNMEVERFAVSDVAASLQNGTVDAVFTFDFQAASLEQSGQFRIVEPEVLRLLTGPSTPPFNGGGVVNAQLLQEDPDKVAAIERALGRALDYIQQNPTEAREELSNILGISIQDPTTVSLDEFSLPDQVMTNSAQITYGLLVEQELAAGGAKIPSLFRGQ